MDPYKTTFETYNKIAQVYHDKFMNLDLYNDTYDLFCRHLEKYNATVLEIGCGPGNITKYILAKRPDYKLTAVDVAPNMIKLAKENNPGAEFICMDCRQLNTLAPYFDGILSGFCMPYLSREDCELLIKNCSDLLHAGGIFYFSLIEDDYGKSGYESGSTGDKAFVYYHQSDYIFEMLNTYGFKCIEQIRKEYPQGEKVSIHLVCIARKE